MGKLGRRLKNTASKSTGLKNTALKKALSAITAATVIISAGLFPRFNVYAESMTTEAGDTQNGEDSAADNISPDFDQLRSLWVKEYKDVPFSERNPEELSVSLEEIEALLDRMEEAANAGDGDAVEAEFRELCDLYDKFKTQYDIYDVLYYQNMSNEEYQDKLSELEQVSADMSDLVMQRLKDIVMIPAAREALIPILPEGTLEYFEEYEPYDEEYKDLLARENDLVMEYNDLSVEMPDNFAQRAGEIYLELLDIRKAQAVSLGYNDYIEYSYDAYGRDYTGEDLEKLYEYVKKYVAPLEEEILNTLRNRDDVDALFEEETTEEGIWSVVGNAVSKIDPSLKGSFDRMMELSLADNSVSDEKMDVGFTTVFPYYGDAYIFNSPYGYFQDYYDMFHEFGHFNAELQSNIPYLFSVDCLDIAEVNSQGLELLSIYYTEDDYGESAGTLAAFLIYEKLESVIDGCLYDEFQKRVYNEQDVTIDRINEIYDEVCEEYGMDPEDLSYEPGVPGWMTVSHNFQQPFYYVSYAVSSLTSLDIFVEAYDDREGAIEDYLALVPAGAVYTYCEAIERYGLRDIFDEDEIKEILDPEKYTRILESYDVEVIEKDYDTIVILLISVLPALHLISFVAALIFAIVTISRSKRKLKQAIKAPRS